MAKKNQQGGLVLNKKTKDNYGTKPNVNNVKVSAGPNFVGEGYTAYNWKSPAWGGQFAMGGSLPGSVGFMYARTQNPAPANGKYTKKTLASAQNGQEMKYYQDGLDFRPKSISQNGSSLNKDLFDLNTQAAQDATRNVIPRVLTDSERKEAKARADAARQRSAEKKKAIVEERMRNKKTKGDLNTPGSWHIQDKFRMFPESVGGLGEIIDDYINPGVVVGGMADALGESIAARDAMGAAKALGISAGLGALGVNPLGDAIKYKNVGSNYLRGLQSQGYQVQGANMFGGLADDFARYMGRLTGRGEESEASRAMNQLQRAEQLPGTRRVQSSDYIPYEPPTEAELAAMNQAEANRYYRRPTQQTTPDPDSFDWSIPRDSQAEAAAQAAQNDMARAASAPVNENALVHPNNRTMTERVLRRRQQSLRDLYGFTDAEIAADEAALRRGEPLRTPAQIRGGGQGTFDLSRSRPSEAPMKEWDPKTFRIGEGDEVGIIKMKHPEGHTIKQDVTKGTDPGASTYRTYEISDDAKGSNYIKVETSQDPGDPFTDVRDISFFNRDPNSSSKQMNIVFSHLPTKARIQPINTSVHSQPLLNTRMAKLSSGQPGRIQIQPERISALNKITRDIAGKPLDWYNDVISQFPKLQRTNQTLNEYTGASLQEPFIRYKGEKLPFEEFNTPEMKRLFEDPHSAYDVLQNTDVMVNKYKTIKNWKNGGHYIDSMGQWAHPGDITTIPSNDITMRGVDYDVMGISNTGDKKLMKPGKNYKFDGDYVTEYPRGGWLEKYK